MAIKIKMNITSVAQGITHHSVTDAQLDPVQKKRAR